MALAEREEGIGHYRSSSTYCASTIIHIRYSGYISLAGLESDLTLGGEYPSHVLCRHENEDIIPNVWCWSVVQVNVDVSVADEFWGLDVVRGRRHVRWFATG